VRETDQGRVPHVPVPDMPVPEAPTHEAPDGSPLSTVLSPDWQELLGFGSMTSQDLSCFGEAASMGSLQELASISIPAVPASQVVNDTPHMHEMPQSVSVFPEADMLRGQEAGETTGETRLARARLACSHLFLAASLMSPTRVIECDRLYVPLTKLHDLSACGQPARDQPATAVRYARSSLQYVCSPSRLHPRPPDPHQMD
jgi:hypothetical protein